jgi:hypothetical protein
MPHFITLHTFDGKPPRKYYGYDSMISQFAGDDLGLDGELCNEYYRPFLEQRDKYEAHEMYGPDDAAIEVLFFDGEPIGVFDNASIGLADLANFETLEQMEWRQGAEDAAREMHADVERELRAAE